MQSYSLILVEVADKNRIPAIKAIRELPGLSNLRVAKDKMDATPSSVLDSDSLIYIHEVAEKFLALGATTTIRHNQKTKEGNTR